VKPAYVTVKLTVQLGTMLNGEVRIEFFFVRTDIAVVEIG